MLHSSGHVIVKIATVVPVTLLVLCTGFLWLLGLPCDRGRREYVTDLSRQALEASVSLIHGCAARRALAREHQATPRGTGPGRRRGPRRQVASPPDAS